MSGIINEIESFWAWSEAQVLALIADIKQGVAIVEADLAAATTWIDNNAPTIVSDIEAVLGIVSTLAGAGVPIPAAVTAAATAATEAAAGLNAFVAESKAGGTTVASVVAGYTAVKQAAVAHATAAVAIAQTPAKAKA